MVTTGRAKIKKPNPIDLLPLKTATAALLFSALLLSGLLAAAPASALPQPQTVEVAALSENFEGLLVYRGWSLSDENPAGGADYWGITRARALEGNYSGWVAAHGDHLTTVELWKSTFENGSAGWTFSDRNATDVAGVDTWGIDGYRFHNGTKSLWCAEVGNNYYGARNAQTNVQRRQYDSYQNSTATIETSLAGYDSVRLEYWFWQNAEPRYDGLYVAWNDGAWHFEDAKQGNQAGLGWQFASYTIPATAQLVGFMFTSDPSVINEGSYVDDVRLVGLRTDPNPDLGLYDDQMDARMTHPVDVSYFHSARVEYRYWLNSRLNDTLQVMVNDGTSWTTLDVRSGSSGGWGALSLDIPTTTKEIGFRFVSNALNRSEGAYIDSLTVFGGLLPITCGATAYETSGMEGVSPFHMAGSASGGLRPYSWAWSFGDGTAVSGPLASIQNPTHTFAEVGAYTPIMTVTDAVGQTCSAPTSAVTVTHDLAHVLVIPATARLTEGADLVLYGFDGQGHPYNLDWELDSPECGLLSATHGTSVTLSSANGAGGRTCTVTGSLGPAHASLRVSILDDTSVIHLAPEAATVVEGTGLRISATDRYGGELPFVWTTSCGRVGGSAASFTLFEAVMAGPASCWVTASYGADSASALMTISHDTRTISVTPLSAQLTEGGAASFSVTDAFGHPFDGAWSVLPAECGAFTLAHGAATTFVASADAGGFECVARVAYGADHRDIPVSISHDVSDASVLPDSISMGGGFSADFRFVDLNGHAFKATWTISPGGCGAFDPVEGSSSTLTVSGDFAGSTCTVSGTGLGFTRFARVTVEYGAPAAVEVLPAAEVIEAGGSIAVAAVVRDAGGHAIPGTSVAWSATGGCVVAPTSGPSTTLATTLADAGAHCTVTARLGALEGSAGARVNHRGPFTVTVSPSVSTVAPGGSLELRADVVDAAGSAVDGSAIVWSATCGVLSSTTGSTVTFTAPATGVPPACAVTASASAGGVAYQASTRVEAAGSLWPLLAAALAAAAGGVFVAMRHRTARLRAAPTAGAPCPRCQTATEAGWVTCPVCGDPLG